MSARSRIEDMLHAFGREVGEPLAFDEDGLCVLEVGDDLECLIAMPTTSDAVAFCINVAPVVAPDRAAFFAHLLTLNYTDEVTRGTALGLDDGGSEVVARYTLPVERLQPGDFGRVVANLAELAATLRADLTTWQDEQLRANPPERPAGDEPRAERARPVLPTDLV